ncbi:DUF4864 domain-containing protein [Pararhizobium sp. IMCC21322]|uniref:DUF4864 domain-containing protein n=1 Tax=Pararhizobium sp. IMCC21322 TaxID=3067903 RepID=UPI0027428DFD|nr:DUF4864 domain-containing protein [Pararhizobium sp. IMCC21322]
MRHFSKLPKMLAVSLGLLVAPAIAEQVESSASKVGTDHLVNVGLTASTQEFQASELLEMRVLVHSYLWAISNKQADLLYLTAAEAVISKYATPNAFLQRMQKVHRPVVNGSLVRFDGVSISDGVPVQSVYIKDERGLQWLASYFLTKQADGQWKIAGCLIVLAPGQNI